MNLRHFCELSDELTEFDLYIDTVFIVYIFCSKGFVFSKCWCEKTVKRGDTQRGITKIIK